MNNQATLLKLALECEKFQMQADGQKVLDRLNIRIYAELNGLVIGELTEGEFSFMRRVDGEKVDLNSMSTLIPNYLYDRNASSWIMPSPWKLFQLLETKDWLCVLGDSPRGKMVSARAHTEAAARTAAALKAIAYDLQA